MAATGYSWNITILTTIRFAYVLSTQLVFWKAISRPFGSFEFRLTCSAVTTGPSCLFAVASSCTTSSCGSKAGHLMLSFVRSSASRGKKASNCHQMLTQTLKILQRKMTSDKPIVHSKQMAPDFTKLCWSGYLTVHIVQLHTVQFRWLIELRFKAILTDVVDMVSAVDVGVGSGHFVATKGCIRYQRCLLYLNSCFYLANTLVTLKLDNLHSALWSSHLAVHTACPHQHQHHLNHRICHHRSFHCHWSSCCYQPVPTWAWFQAKF